MKLIKVSDRVQINPDYISKIEIKRIRDKDILRVVVDRETIPVEVNPGDFLNQLKSVGVESHGQFWAG